MRWANAANGCRSSALRSNAFEHDRTMNPTGCSSRSSPTAIACADMRRFEACDFALLAAFITMTVLGTWNRALLLNDGAYFLSVGWLGDAWDLYFSQFVGRAIPLLFSFGPAWAFRWAFTPSAATYMTLAHLLYFAAPLCFWLAIRAVEPQRAFSRLYLATMLALVYFPSEVVIGAGLWTVWAALLADPARSRTQAVSMTLAFALILAFTHPAM